MMTPAQQRARRRAIVAHVTKQQQLESVTISNQPPTVTPFASQIDPSYPVYGTPTTQSVRDNFQYAADEITALQVIKVEDCPANPPGAGWIRYLGVWVNAIDGGTF